jgi:hypothetical protein
LAVGNSKLLCYNLKPGQRHKYVSLTTSTPIQSPRQIIIDMLYNVPYIILNDQNARTIIFYNLMSSLSIEATIDYNMHPGSVLVSTKDNLVVVFNLAVSKSFIFDIKGNNPHLPLFVTSPPFPNFDTIYDYIICESPESFKKAVYILQIDLAEIVNTMIQANSSIKLNLEFITRREATKSIHNLIFKHLFEHILNTPSLAGLDCLFTIVLDYFLFTTYITNFRNKSKSQYDNDLCNKFLKLVFEPLVPLLSSKLLTSVILQFIDSCHAYMLPLDVDSSIYLLFSKILCENESTKVKFYQLIECHMIPDIILIANYLISVIDDRNSFSMGISMLSRLGEDSLVLDAHLGAGKPLEAIQYAISKGCVDLIKPIPLLSVCHILNDHTLFFNVYRF